MAQASGDGSHASGAIGSRHERLEPRDPCWAARGTDAPVNPIASFNRVGHGAYNDYVENGLSPLRNRNELFLRLRYTF